MPQPPIRFDDGDAYERFMGAWSRSVGHGFLEFLSAPPGQRWLDVGCGNGVFTELVAHNCAPGELQGIDPSEGQIGFARKRLGGRNATFRQGDAMELPYADNQFDIAVMALVIPFVPQPSRGVAEMARVVRPGGTVAAYVWDQLGGGSPSEPFRLELLALGIDRPNAPNDPMTTIAALTGLWADAGLEAVETQAITVRRTYDSFDQLWSYNTGAGGTQAAVAAMDAETVARFQAGLRARLPADAEGRITYATRAHAIKGQVAAAA